MSLLEVENLSVRFQTRGGTICVVDNVSFTLNAGDTLGVVGESGSGKSVTSLAIMGLINSPGIVSADKLLFNGKDILHLSAKARRHLLGKDIAMIFQDPLSSLNPCFTVEDQITETLKIHEGGSKKARRERAEELLSAVGIPDPKARLKAFPHELSGGMSQRVMIAMAIACSPKLLIADEPTTALDVTIQAQILDLLLELNEKQHMGLILITHDLAVVAETVKSLLVMYCGQVVESGPTHELLYSPSHPYTEALLNAIPEHETHPKGEPLNALPGTVPSPYNLPQGCRLRGRCPYEQEKCLSLPNLAGNSDHKVRCFFPLSNSGGKP